MPSGREQNSAPAAALLLVLLVVPLVAYGFYVTRPPSPPLRSVFGDLLLQSTSVDITGLQSDRLDLGFEVVVYNPNFFGATLEAVNYSVSSNGNHLGSGQTTREYELAPRSSQTLVFPISVAWTSALQITDAYVVSRGNLSWEVSGVAVLSVGGVTLSAPFQFTTG